MAVGLCAALAGSCAAAATPAAAAGSSGGGTVLALACLAVLLAAAVGVLLTHRRLAPELRQARTDYQALAALLDVWRWQTDREHRLLQWSPPADAPPDAWSGWPIGQTWWEVPQAATVATAGPGELAARMRAGAAFSDVLAARMQPDGTAAHWLLRGTPLYDADGRFSGYVGTARPAAAPAAAAAEAPAQNEAAERGLGELSDQEAFSYTVSHDLRAPIRVVEGFARIVKEDYGRVLDRIGIDHLDRVLGAAARMNSMIDALLNLSQLSSQPLARQPVNLSQLAGFVIDDLRRNAPERQVEVHIDPGLSAQGDPTLLRVVLENLLGNAWKYTARTAQPKIWFEAAANGEPHCYTLRDNGAGFDMRFADRLFGVFQRLHSTSDFQGTGIGLASVRRVVRRHGGEIWAESEVGRGAAFHFTLRA